MSSPVAAGNLESSMASDTIASPTAGMTSVVEARDTGAAVETVERTSAASMCSMWTCYCNLLFSHERIGELAGRRERFLDGTGAHPANEIQLGAGLVVRAGAARPAKRLLPDHRAGRLVVDVEVSRSIPEHAHRFAYRHAVAAEHGAGQCVR